MSMNDKIGMPCCPKVLPTEGQNANSLNIRQAVFAAAAAFDMPLDKATLSSSAGLALVSQRGASEQQMKEFGEGRGADRSA